MPEPQPGADRPVDGSRPDEHRDGEPAVTHELPTDPAAVDDQSASSDETKQADTQPADVAPTEAGSPADVATPTRVDRPADADPDDGQPSVPPEPPVGPQGTRVLSEAAPEAVTPRWSGSAPVPPAAPRRRGWGESAEPTPPPAPPVSPVPQPEHQTPVDPWAGVDTSGWDLPSTDFPALPPTLSYPSPPPTRPYSGPPAPVSPVPQPPPAPRHQPPPAPQHQLPPGVGPQQQPQQPGPYPPLPAGPPASPPPRGRRGRKKAKAGPAAPAPGWPPAQGHLPKPPRKRRRWPWLLLLTLACCCGCPAYYGVPMASQYPANATVPQQVADLRLREDPRSTRDARQLETQMREAHWLADGTFAGIYHTSNGKRVTVFGGTGFRFTPSADADAEIERLKDQYALGDAQVMETGVRGRHERCAVGRTDGVGAVVCTSVDHGSITTGVFTGLSVDDSSRLLGTLRDQIVTTEG
ncbi:hypothetical protein ACFFMR_12185 [Micromonospora andamanensis]|uniref:Uncharacterized protein n=1 Tax=Micromonospora andamanensis TaxID=1287068 RepID=A0ABQ4HTR3_9ACTN|nr:hypothetical protein [Micromonospora andamanensis]GIJ09048.1 hypothetical protein Van01_22620 [Micromonospora andamanensis]